MTKGSSVLQRIIAGVLIVAGLAGIGLAIASATVWRESDTVVATTSFSGDATYLVTDPGVLDLVDDDVTITARVPGEQRVSLVIGRDVDVEGWAAFDPYAAVTGLTDWEALATRLVEPEPEPAEEPAEGEEPAEDATEDEATEGEEAEPEPVVGPDPAVSGADMWVASASDTGEVTLRWTDQPGRWRLVAAGVGEDAVAPTLELTWPREVTTPWLWPGVLAGTALVLLGAALLAVSLRSRRRKPTGKPLSGRAAVRTGTIPAVALKSTVSVPPSTPAPVADGASGARTQEPSVPTRRSARAAAPAAAASAAPPAGSSSPAAAGGADETPTALTRRQLREQAEAERAARESGERGQRPRMRWMTGQIPIVPRDKRPRTAAQPVVRPADDRATSRSSATADDWRTTWGFQKTTPAPDEPPAGGQGADGTPTGGDR